MENISKKRAMSFILFTTFLAFMGFSIIIPVLPFIVKKYLPSGNINDIAWYVGVLMSIYALCQFISAPGLGALSDRFGRRPILLISLFGSVIGYILLGIGGSLWILFLGRIIDGLTGGNISTIYSYIADITEPKDRGKYFGMLGAAGGVGFMLGPAIGGVTSLISLSAPLYLAAAITFINIIWGYFVLPESINEDHRVKKLNLLHLNPFTQFNHIFSVTALKWLFSISFLFFLGLMAMQGNASVYFHDIFKWNPSQISIVFFLVGLIDIISQGFLVRKLLPLYGDFKVALMGLTLAFIGFLIYALLSFFHSPVLLFVGVVILITGDGLIEPSLSGLISNAVGPQMQGRVQGANQGMQSIARIIGPLYAAFVYQNWKGLPYLSGAFLVFIAILFHISYSPKVGGKAGV
jgi:DHA1 family tetracycline resistance protein-like MFS transporter